MKSRDGTGGRLSAGAAPDKAGFDRGLSQNTLHGVGKLHDFSRISPNSIDVGGGIRVEPLMGGPIAEILENVQQPAKLGKDRLILEGGWHNGKDSSQSKTALTASKNKEK